MANKVLRAFTDKVNREKYVKGDEYPHKGKVNNDRLKELEELKLVTREENLTVPVIKERLTKQGLEFSATAKKEELLAILDGESAEEKE